MQEKSAFDDHRSEGGWPGEKTERHLVSRSQGPAPQTPDCGRAERPPRCFLGPPSRGFVDLGDSGAGVESSFEIRDCLDIHRLVVFCFCASAASPCRHLHFCTFVSIYLKTLFFTFVLQTANPSAVARQRVCHRLSRPHRRPPPARRGWRRACLPHLTR